MYQGFCVDVPKHPLFDCYSMMVVYITRQIVHIMAPVTASGKTNKID
jgi:hypothetical protein